MTDLLLIHPPQWTPFQPPLSLAALSAWLKRAGFEVRSRDLNLAFYEWLLSDECAEILLSKPPGAGRDRNARAADRALLASVGEIRREVAALRHADPSAMSALEYVRRHFLGARSLETYLKAVSRASGAFTVTSRGFQWLGALRPSSVEALVASPPAEVAPFLAQSVERLLAAASPRLIGVSCVGSEQLGFSLLLGAMLKARSDAPVVIGGSVFPALLDSGALPPEWFGRFFDAVVRNEGEKPCEAMLANLRAGRALTAGVPGVIHDGGRGLSASPAYPPLEPAEVPVPDYSDLPLDRYLIAETTLPILASRGCYWGRCEFCTFGKTYGRGHAAYSVDSVLETVRALAAAHGASHFVFHDEAIPPKTLRRLGEVFPSHEESGWIFNAMVRFEKYFEARDFENLRRIGFRVLQFGLESGSERVRALMGKPVPGETVLRNLTAASRAAIWNHCFVFFGFPGETHEDARQTCDFILSRSDIVDSVGTDLFALAHGARMFQHLDDFGVRPRPRSDEISPIYGYEVEEGVTAKEAGAWLGRLHAAAAKVPKYRISRWIPPELGVALLAVMPIDRVVSLAGAVCEGGARAGATGLVEVVVLDLLTARFFKSLAPPAYHPFLESVTAGGAVVAVGAFWLGRAAGVALATIDEDSNAEVLFVAFPPGDSGAVVGGRLLASLHRELSRRGETVARGWTSPDPDSSGDPPRQRGESTGGS